MNRYRLVIFDKPGPWRRSRAEVEEEAIDLGHAVRDEYAPERLYLGPRVRIEGEPR
jgi:hypothetical protein